MQAESEVKTISDRLARGKSVQRAARESLSEKAHSQSISIWLPLLLTHSQAGPPVSTHILFVQHALHLLSGDVSPILYVVVLGKCFRREGKGGEEKDRKKKK